MTKRFNFPPGFFDTPFVDTTTGLILPEKQLDLQTFLIGDNLPDGNTRQQTKASNLLASDIPTNSDFEEFNDTGVVAYAWEGQWDDAGTTTLTRDFYRPSTSAFRGSKCQMLISPDNVRGSSIASQPFAVKPFLQWHPSVWAKSDAALPAGAKGFRCRIAWFNGNSDFSKAGVASYSEVVLGADTTLSTAFQEFGADVTVPASARFARFVLCNHGPSKGSNFASNILVDTTSWGLKAINTVAAAYLLTSIVTTNSAALVLIPGMTVTLTTNGAPVLLNFNGVIRSDTAGSQMGLSFYRDGAAIGLNPTHTFALANDEELIAFTHADNPAAGSHTYEARWQIITGGITLTAPAQMREIQVIQLP
jgi:hypothetical protein